MWRLSCVFSFSALQIFLFLRESIFSDSIAALSTAALTNKLRIARLMCVVVTADWIALMPTTTWLQSLSGLFAWRCRKRIARASVWRARCFFVCVLWQNDRAAGT